MCPRNRVNSNSNLRTVADLPSESVSHLSKVGNPEVLDFLPFGDANLDREPSEFGWLLRGKLEEAVECCSSPCEGMLHCRLFVTHEDDRFICGVDRSRDKQS